MKMANRKRIFALLLALVTVLALVPAAAVSAAVVESSAASGSTLNFTGVNYTATWDAGGYITQYVNNVPVKKYYGTFSVDSIDGVYASDWNMGTDVEQILQSNDVSLYASLDSNYDVNTIKNSLNTTLSQNAATAGNGATYFAVPSFSSSYKNVLKSASVYYTGSTSKTIYLYAKVTPYIYRFNTDSYYPYASIDPLKKTVYKQIGSVTLYPNYYSNPTYGSLNISLNETYGTIGVNQPATLIATVPGASNIQFVASTTSAPGISEIKEVYNGIFQISSNGLPSTNNVITITAYQMQDATLTKYVYRATNGLEVYDTNLVQYKEVGGVRYYPVFGTATATYSTETTVTGITFSKSVYSLEVGDSVYASVTTAPYGASVAVRYATSNAAVAAVSDSGLITATGVGSATIYATTSSGAMATAYVTVTPTTATLVLDKANVTVEVGATETVKATLITNLPNKGIIWNTSNSSIATVVNGVITGKKAGSCVITASYAGNSNKVVYCNVTVKEPDAKFELKEELTLVEGEKANLNATITGVTNKTLIYASDKTSVAKVDSKGNVTAVKAGVAMITVTSAQNAEFKAYCVVTVKAAEVEEPDEDAGIIERTAKYNKNSKYYSMKAIGAGEVKTALSELKGADEVNVVIDVTSKSGKNRIGLTRYAVSWLDLRADYLTLKVGDYEYVLDEDDLDEMNNGRPVYIYTNGEDILVRYKNAKGTLKTFSDVDVDVYEAE